MVFEISVAAARPELDEALSAGLDVVNEARTRPTAAAEELTVAAHDGADVAGGVSGWTWGEAAGIGMVWIAESQRGSGLGTRLMEQFEQAARQRGARRVFVTSFTFQAPGFYERLGYTEIFRWQGVPVEGHDDVHFRKDLD